MTYEQEYREAIIKCGKRYRHILETHPINYDKLTIFVDALIDCCEHDASIPKMCRWLGYIQGVMIAEGLTTVESERNWTRPLFKHLDNYGDTNAR